MRWILDYEELSDLQEPIIVISKQDSEGVASESCFIQ
jgi:hypothetical protein